MLSSSQIDASQPMASFLRNPLGAKWLSFAVIVAVACGITWRLWVASDVVVFVDAWARWRFVNWAHRVPLLIEQFRNVFLHGWLYPRWLPELMKGNGYPTFLFYQPALFFLALPF